MSGFIQPQWSGFGPPAVPRPVPGEAGRQPSGLEIERTLLGRPAKPWSRPPQPSASIPERMPVTQASPRTDKA